MPLFSNEKKLNQSVKVGKDSIWFSGHFPDDPVLPGIAQLELVIKLISSYGGKNLCLKGLSRIKFRKIVRPNEQLDIHATSDNKEGQYSFQIKSGAEIVSSGKIIFSIL